MRAYLNVINFQQAKTIIKEGEIEKLVDPRIGEDFDIKKLHLIAFAASLCIRSSSPCRPSMIEVRSLCNQIKVIGFLFKYVYDKP